jgi:two-component system phosphate regulon response regulator PhoB
MASRRAGRYTTTHRYTVHIRTRRHRTDAHGAGRGSVARAPALRPPPKDTLDVIEIQGLRLDPETCRVTAGETIVDISPTEFRLLHFFIKHPEKVYNRAQLLDQVWGQNVYVEERTVDVHIRRLRKTLEPFGFDKYIQTVRSFGYRFSIK